MSSQEIERKFLVSAWNPGYGVEPGANITQGYLCHDPEVRVRLYEKRAYLTIKANRSGSTRTEIELELDQVHQAELLLALCKDAVVTKTRFRVNSGEDLWEVDVYDGRNAGLVTAEIEVSTADHQVELPDWIGAEVTGDRRYDNASLARHPYAEWPHGD